MRQLNSSLIKNLNTPVLFMIFNRIEPTIQVFEQIRKAKPPRLYVASDGARETKQGENELVEKVRTYIVNSVDWDCEVFYLFRENNLGCKIAVSEAITWFFQHEEQGIILEDDCKPSQSFFWFCEDMLNYYKNDMRIWHISGNNFQKGVQRGEGSYYYSRYAHIWGWATWANRWQRYDVSLNTFSEFKKRNKIKYVFENKREQQFWLCNFQQIIDEKINTWDYQWEYCVIVNNGLCITPSVNLISNIGFGENATHTFDPDSELANIQEHDIAFPLIHPKFMILDKEADKFTGLKFFVKKKLFDRIRNKLKTLII